MQFPIRNSKLYSCYSTLFYLFIFKHLMDGPKAPDAARSWESIDIFLFSNGEQFSPPRKYHLSCDDLRWWEATIRFLAKSQYGSTNHNIQLYTLDGKQVQSPLELRNDNAYVAVKSPEPFIWAGYEEYIVKACRSREKRQEKLPNSSAPTKLGDKNSNELINLLMPTDVIATEKTEGDVSKLNMVHQIPNKDQHKDNIRTELVYSGMPKVLKKNNMEIDNQKRHCKDILKNDMMRKSQTLKPLKKEQLLVKRKNSALIRKANDNSQIKQFISQNSLSAPVNNIKPKEKNQQKTKENTNIKNVVKGKSNDIPGNIVNQTENITKSNGPNLSNNNVSENKNNEKKNHSTMKINDNNSNMFSPNNKKSQEFRTNAVNKDKNINIFLDIKLNSCKKCTMEDTDVLKKCESNVTLLSHKESQVNIDVVLNKENISFINNEPKIENSPETPNNATEIKDTGNKNKFMVVYCKCSSKINTQSENYLKENTNLAFLLPIQEQNVYCPHEIKVQMVDKANQASSPSSTSKSSNDQIVKVPDDTSLQRKIDEKINKEDIVRTNTSEAQQLKQTSDKFTQTDMSNILLQVNSEKDGHYTFCLPPLALLKNYNIDTT